MDNCSCCGSVDLEKMINPKSLINGANIRYRNQASFAKWQDTLGNVSDILDDVSHFELPKIKTESEVKPSSGWYVLIIVAIGAIFLFRKS